jgi:hypothetical protein
MPLLLPIQYAEYLSFRLQKPYPLDKDYHEAIRLLSIVKEEDNATPRKGNSIYKQYGRTIWWLK